MSLFKHNNFSSNARLAVHLTNECDTFQEAYNSIALFIEVVYNQKLLHTSLNYLIPVEFENTFTNSLETQNNLLLAVEKQAVASYLPSRTPKKAV
jgi:hypothetical protein